MQANHFFSFPLQWTTLLFEATIYTVIQTKGEDFRNAPSQFLIYMIKATFVPKSQLLVPWTENHLSSFKRDFLNIFSRQTCCVVCHAYCFCYGGTDMAQKMSEKPHSIRLLRWFNFNQPGSRENNRKAFGGASMEPIIAFTTLSTISTCTCGTTRLMSQTFEVP